MSQAKYEIDMCSGAVLPKVLKLTLPLLLSSVLQLLFNAADIIVVGNFASENSLAAVGSTASLVNLMTNLFLGLSTSTNVLTAMYMGAGEPEKVNRTIHTSILLSIISGAIMTLVGAAENHHCGTLVSFAVVIYIAIVVHKQHIHAHQSYS